jgi:hypothetical protein
MSTKTENVRWAALEHAYGRADDIPAILEAFSKAPTKLVYGSKLFDVTNELYSRVLHQGTIYSASPPVAHFAIEMLPKVEIEKKGILYSLLSGMAEAPRKAFADGRAIPCHAGGDPEDGAAIRDEILAVQSLFAADLADPDPEIRGYAADLVTSFPEIEPRGAATCARKVFCRAGSAGEEPSASWIGASSPSGGGLGWLPRFRAPA